MPKNLGYQNLGLVLKIRIRISYLLKEKIEKVCLVNQPIFLFNII